MDTGRDDRAERRAAIEWRSAYWIVPWLAGLGIIVAIFSLAIFYSATRSGMPRPKALRAAEDVEAEASAELATPMT